MNFFGMQPIGKASMNWTEPLLQAGWGIAVADASGMVLEHVNPALARMHGYDKTEDLIGFPFLNLLAEDSRMVFPDHLARAMRSSHHNFESTHVRKDGSRFPLLIDITFVNLAWGRKVLYCLTDGVDAAERFRTKDSLRKLSTIVEQTADAVLVTDRNGIIEYVNPSFERLTGYDKTEVTGKTPSLLKSGKHNQHFYADLWNTILLGHPYIGVLVNKRKNGELYYSQKTITPLQTNGVITHFVSTDKDITQAKIAEDKLKKHAEDLQRSNRDLEMFASFISHDLQAPIRYVVSYLQLIKRRLGDVDAQTLEYLDYAVIGGKQMQLMIHNMLNYSRAGNKVSHLPTNCEEVLQEVLGYLALTIEEKQAKITHLPLPMVKADRIQLLQLFQNLIGNALKYHDHNSPEVHIEAHKKKGEWIFSVRDNGIGIHPSAARRIFCLFQRLHGETEYPGSGIGLAICEKIVTQHGGRLWVESQPGLGSTFFFTLPCLEEEAEALRS